MPATIAARRTASPERAEPEAKGERRRHSIWIRPIVVRPPVIVGAVRPVGIGLVIGPVAAVIMVTVVMAMMALRAEVGRLARLPLLCRGLRLG